MHVKTKADIFTRNTCPLTIEDGRARENWSKLCDWGGRALTLEGEMYSRGRTQGRSR